MLSGVRRFRYAEVKRLDGSSKGMWKIFSMDAVEKKTMSESPWQMKVIQDGGRIILIILHERGCKPQSRRNFISWWENIKSCA
jgi:hypothetical protein